MGNSAHTIAVGVEEEFHVIDPLTRRLTPRAGELLKLLPPGGFTAEFRESVVETNSAPHTRLTDLRADLVAARAALVETAARIGLGIAASGTVPLTGEPEIGTTPDPRYLGIAESYQLVADEQLICGAQVHVDVADRDLAVAAMSRLAPWLPVLLALSASSPFWCGRDTGYASWRTLVWQRWPTTGPPGGFTSAAEYDETIAALVRSGVICDAGMLYYDVRPSAHLPTLELRICDACPGVDDVVLIAALARALVLWACDEVTGGPARPAPRPELLRAATWRAARSGLEDVLVDPRRHAAAPAADVVRDMLRTLRPHLEAAGDWEPAADRIEELLGRGSSAARQREAVRRAGSPAAAVDLVLATTRAATG